MVPSRENIIIYILSLWAGCSLRRSVSLEDKRRWRVRTKMLTSVIGRQEEIKTRSASPLGIRVVLLTLSAGGIEPANNMALKKIAKSVGRILHKLMAVIPSGPAALDDLGSWVAFDVCSYVQAANWFLTVRNIVSPNVLGEWGNRCRARVQTLNDEVCQRSAVFFVELMVAFISKRAEPPGGCWVGVASCSSGSGSRGRPRRLYGPDTAWSYYFPQILLLAVQLGLRSLAALGLVAWCTSPRLIAQRRCPPFTTWR